MKKIGFWAALALVIGNILGVGIFTTTGYLAGQVSGPWYILLAWVIGAVYAITGGLVYGYLARLMPERGGDYVYLKRHYHPFFACLFGWSGLAITYTGSIAALAIGAAHYLNDALPVLHLEQVFWQADAPGLNFVVGGMKVAALLFILLFTVINYLGIRVGGETQIVLTAGIVLLMVGFIAAGLASGARQPITSALAGGDGGLSGFFTGLAAVLFTYMGWTTVVYIANEVERPQKNIPKALISGVLIVVVLYVGINYVFLSTFPARELADQINVASKVAAKLWGTGATRIIAAMILLAILSSLNSTVLSGPRIYQAMAGDGYLWPAVAREHKKYQTPHTSLLVQGVWSVVLLFSGTFNQLLTIVVAAILLFSILTGTVSLKLLWRAKKYFSNLMAATIIYLVLCGLILLNILATRLTESILGFLILSLSIPLYWWQTRATQSVN